MISASQAWVWVWVWSAEITGNQWTNSLNKTTTTKKDMQTKPQAYKAENKKEKVRRGSEKRNKQSASYESISFALQSV